MADKITGETSDGYHTFNELYEHRIVLFLALCNYASSEHTVWCSKLHSDGSSFDGWFIVGIGVDLGSQISYHLPMSRWSDAVAIMMELPRAPDFDGHTSADVLKRLEKMFK